MFVLHRKQSARLSQPCQKEHDQPGLIQGEGQQQADDCQHQKKSRLVYPTLPAVSKRMLGKQAQFSPL